MVSVDMNYQDYCDYINKSKKAYVDYLVDQSHFAYLYYQILKPLELPSLYFNNPSAELNEVKQKVINNTDDFLTGVDLTVKWLDEDTVDKLWYRYGLNSHKYIVDSAHTGGIFDIPLKASKTFGSYVEFYNEPGEDFKTRIYKKIALLDDEEPETIESSYFHELGHVLVGRNWYTVMNPLLNEYVPHFLELFYNYFIIDNQDIFVKGLVYRIIKNIHKELVLSKDARNLSAMEEENLTYLVAFFLACITFERYCELDLRGKKEMECDLKLVFNGLSSVEQFMNKYDINLHTDETITLFNRTTERVKSYKI